LALEPKSFDFHQFVSYRNQTTGSGWREPLFTFPYGPEAGATNFSPLPRLVESWSLADGGKSVDIVLKKGVMYQNKGPIQDLEMSAEDVKFSLDRSLELSSTGKSQLKSVTSVEVTDPYKVRINQDAPFGPLFVNLGQQYNAILPKASVDEFGDLVSFESAVGTGPWTPTEYSPGSFLKLERHAGYWNEGLPYIDVVEEIFISEYPAADAAFRSGQLDITAIDTDCMSGERYQAIKDNSPDAVPTIFPDTANARTLTVRNDKAPFDNATVRQAVSLGIDRQGWIDSVLGGFGINQAFINPGQGKWWRDFDQLGDKAKWLQFDPAEGKRILAEEGVEEGLKVVLDGTSGYGPRIEAELQLMGESLRKNLGFDVQLNITEYSSNFLPNVWGKGDYEDLAYGFQGGGLDANGWLTFAYHSQTRGGFYNHLDDPELDKMLDAMDQETDVESRVQMVYDIEDYLLDTMPAIPVPSWVCICYQQSWIHNYNYFHWMDMLGPIAFAWVDRDQKTTFKPAAQ
jgi:peptide/nickel transport system substrate-binding protein